MNNTVLKFVCQLEGWKTAIKNLHWNSQNMSQHKLFDDIADSLSDFQDKISEVEQSISGNLPYNKLQPVKYSISTPQKFLQDVVSGTKSFYAKLQKMGDNYIGMRSDCEAYLSDVQRQQYLLNFTLKESLRKRLKRQINESKDRLVEVSNGRRTYNLPSSELKRLIREAMENVIGSYVVCYNGLKFTGEMGNVPFSPSKQDSPVMFKSEDEAVKYMTHISKKYNINPSKLSVDKLG